MDAVLWSGRAPEDILWVLVCGFLVLLMQAGFTCLESGMVRAKNSVNVAIKNLVDFCVSVTLYFLVGYGLMFGASAAGIVGTDQFFLTGVDSVWGYTFFFFQAVFCGAATTIVSGAVAERMSFAGYFMTAIIISGFIYPTVGHWAWGGLASGETTGWLGQLGFIDFAGSTVVHSVGGWVALAATIIIGPRLGRFGSQGRPIEGHSLPMATLGAFLLWFGWFGFNGGSTLGLTSDIPLIITNTTLSAGAGGLAGMVFSWRRSGMPQVDGIINGVLAGLVGITANCHIVSPTAALAIGAVSGLVAIYGAIGLAKIKIDDAIGAVPVHLFAGVWGTMAVALFAPAGSWGEGVTRSQQFVTQLEGIAAIGLFAFCVSFLFLKAIDRFVRLRVGFRSEVVGLNIAEHGASTALLDLINQMDFQGRHGDFTRPVRVEPETEAAQIASFYNTVLDKFNLETDRRKLALQRVSQLANYDTLTGCANRRLFLELLKQGQLRARRHQRPGAIFYIDLDGFKRINDRYGHGAGDLVLKEIARRMQRAVREDDVVGRLGGDEFALLADEIDNTEVAVALAEKLIATTHEPIALLEGSAAVGMSIGIAIIDPERGESVKGIIRRADEAMYEAKMAGKGVCRVSGETVEEL